MNDPIRILHVVTKMDRAGLETMLMNYYRHMDRDKVQFDFLTHREDEGAYDAEILSMGGRIYHVSSISPNHFGVYLKQLRVFFMEHREYRIVHAHLDALSGIVLYAAKRAGIRVRIAHSHTNSFDFDWKLPFRQVARYLITINATQLWGCSRAALKFMFGDTNHVQKSIIRNAIECSEYVFFEERREAIRQALGVADSFVIGHVGRFVRPKNHRFLLRVFEQLKKMDKRAFLLLVGSGELEASIKKQASAMRLSDSIKFMGFRKDIPDLLQAMDIFVMPSRFEGLGIAGIEAQAAGLPVIFSDEVPQEAKITENVTFLSLHASPYTWAQAILVKKGQPRADTREDIAKSGYDICSAAKVLEQEYCKLYGETTV